MITKFIVEVESDLPSHILLAGLDVHVNTWKKYEAIKHYKISEVKNE